MVGVLDARRPHRTLLGPIVLAGSLGLAACPPPQQLPPAGGASPSAVPPSAAPPELGPPPAADPPPAGGTVGNPAPAEPGPLGAYQPVSEAELAAIAASNNTFGASLYAKVSRAEGNFAFSPTSIAVALGMTWGGARGETAAQMRRTLALGLDAPTTHRAYGTLLRHLDDAQARPYELAVANRLFGEATQPFRAEFLALTADHYRAELERIDFEHASDPSRAHINAWVEDHTKKRIRELLPEGSITPDTRLVLANAIYFKGDWKLAFPDKDTRPEPFQSAAGAHPVPMMHLETRLRYGHVDGVEALELPYKGDEVAMTVLLPDTRDGIGALEQKLDADAVARWSRGAQARKVTVSLPRFVIDPPQSISLAKILRELGMPLAFDPGAADFGGMAEPVPGERLFLSDAIHKAFVEVNEKGTEAAAATAVIVARTTSVHVEPSPAVFVADHPFVFLVRDLRTGAILFVGRVSDPAAR